MKADSRSWSYLECCSSGVTDSRDTPGPSHWSFLTHRPFPWNHSCFSFLLKFPSGHYCLNVCMSSSFVIVLVLFFPQAMILRWLWYIEILLAADLKNIRIHKTWTVLDFFSVLWVGKVYSSIKVIYYLTSVGTSLPSACLFATSFSFLSICSSMNFPCLLTRN